MILRMFWNSDIMLHNASNVRIEFSSRFMLRTTQIMRYFIHQNVVGAPHLQYWIIYVISPFLLKTYYEKFDLKPVFRKCIDFCGVLLEHSSKPVSLFGETPVCWHNWIYISYRVLSLYCKESLQLPGHPVAVAILGNGKAKSSWFLHFSVSYDYPY